MSTSTSTNTVPDSSRNVSGEPVWRILTGFAIFALGIFLFGSTSTYNPQDPSLNAATDQDVTNLFGSFGAITADLLVQLLGWGGSVAAFLIFAAGIKRMLLIGHSDAGKWAMALLGVLAVSACLAGWPVPSHWPIAARLGGVIGDILFSLAKIPFAAFRLPFPEVFAAAGLGIAAFFLICNAANIGNRDLNMLLAVFWRNLKRLVLIILVPLGPLGRWLGAKLVSGVSILKNQIIHWMNREPEMDPYMNSSFRRDDAENMRYYQHEEKATQTKASSERSSQAEADPFVKPKEKEQPKTEAPKPGPRPSDSSARLRPKMTPAQGMPSLDLLVTPPHRAASVDEAMLLQRAEHLMQILTEFGVKGRITHVRPGPVVTLFELEPAAGVKSSRVISLADDVARSMSATSARIAVVPGKNAIGIELPNKGRETVYLRTLLESPSFTSGKQALPLALGEDIGGEPVCADLAKMPHLLIAGTTGSGKSVGINAMILSLMYKLPPEKCRFIMVDPKMLELSIYEGVPHLLSPVVVDPKKAVTALKWAVREMESRYEMMSKAGVRNLVGFNEKVEELKRTGGRLTKEVQTGYEADTGRPIFEIEEIPLDQLPNIVIVIDEMADLMMVAGKEIEACIQRLAQMARAAGIHLITATQRPSVDVITGTIKANFPTRISYMVSSKIDSRTILNEQGAEQLLGMGDLLYMASGGKIKRLHGPFVSDEEVGDIVNFLKSTGEPDYKSDITEEPDDDPNGSGGSPVMDAMLGGNDEADLYANAVQVVLKDKRASTSYVQRRLGIGYNRAASIIERMEDEGIVSAPNHSGRREILKKGPGED